MSSRGNLLSVAAVVGVLWLGAAHVLAQEDAGGEGVIPVPTTTSGEPLDPQSFMGVLYVLVAVVAAVAAVATILLAMRMDQVRGRRLTEAERRLGRMLTETKSEFEEGREEGQLPG